jgi:hypothetical protein
VRLTANCDGESKMFDTGLDVALRQKFLAKLDFL